MQQTDKYKLNLIERDDVFSPDALNENAQKLEGALEEVESAQEAADQALDDRLKVFEAHRIAIGTYTGGSNLEIELGFTPKVVVIITLGNLYYSCLLLSEEYGRKNTAVGTITTNGFTVVGKTNASRSTCDHGYIAFR